MADAATIPFLANKGSPDRSNHRSSKQSLFHGLIFLRFARAVNVKADSVDDEFPAISLENFDLFGVGEGVSPVLLIAEEPTELVGGLEKKDDPVLLLSLSEDVPDLSLEERQCLLRSSLLHIACNEPVIYHERNHMTVFRCCRKAS